MEEHAEQPRAKRPRIGHKKTRTGCVQCKKRRVKCDELKPRCTACTRRSQSCSLSSTIPNLPYVYPSPSPSPLPIIPGFSTSSSTVQISDTTFTLEDMYLLHNYTISTSLTLTTLPSKQLVCQTVIPRIACTSPLVLHGLLAVSALHLAHQHPPCSPTPSPSAFPSAATPTNTIANKRRHYAHLATAHQQAALVDFRTALAQPITRANCEGLVVFSAMLHIAIADLDHDMPSSSSRSHSHEEEGAAQDLDVAARWLVLMRGVPSLLRTSDVWEWTCDGPLRPLLRQTDVPEPEDLPLPPSGALRDTFLALEAMVQGMQAEECGDAAAEGGGGGGGGGAPLTAEMVEAERAIYASALTQLRRFAVFLSTPAIDATHCRLAVTMVWPNTVSDAFVQRVMARKPVAMVLMAHFGVLLKRVDHVWWFTGWGERVVRNAWGVLGPEWRGWVEGPWREVVGGVGPGW